MKKSLVSEILSKAKIKKQKYDQVICYDVIQSHNNIKFFKSIVNNEKYIVVRHKVYEGDFYYHEYHIINIKEFGNTL